MNLLPCPFCGSAAKESEGGNGEWWILCSDDSCDISPIASAQEPKRARSMWNKRPTYVNREPDGWAVTQPDGTSSPRGFWFVGCYLDKKMAEQIVRKVAQGAEAKPIYFAPSSTCEGGEGT